MFSLILQCKSVGEGHGKSCSTVWRLNTGWWFNTINFLLSRRTGNFFIWCLKRWRTFLHPILHKQACFTGNYFHSVAAVGRERQTLGVRKGAWHQHKRSIRFSPVQGFPNFWASKVLVVVVVVGFVCFVLRSDLANAGDSSAWGSLGGRLGFQEPQGRRRFGFLKGCWASKFFFLFLAQSKELYNSQNKFAISANQLLYWKVEILEKLLSD